jgi:hypothetical protein
LEELAVSEFWIGFEKRATPRWYKEFTKYPAKFIDSVTGGLTAAKDYQTSSSVGGHFEQLLRLVRNGENVIPIESTWTVDPVSKGLTDRRQIQNLLNWHNRLPIHLEKSMSDPLKRSLYVKTPHGIARLEPRPSIPRIEKHQMDALSDDRALLAKGDRGTEIPHRYFTSKKMVPVSHTSSDPEGLLNTSRTFTPSSFPKGYPTENIYVFPKHRTQENTLNAVIPEKHLLYGYNSSAPMTGEATVPSKIFKEHLKKAFQRSRL